MEARTERSVVPGLPLTVRVTPSALSAATRLSALPRAPSATKPSIVSMDPMKLTVSSSSFESALYEMKHRDYYSVFGSSFFKNPSK